MLNPPTAITDVVEQLCLHLDLMIVTLQQTNGSPQMIADCVLLKQAITNAYSA